MASAALLDHAALSEVIADDQPTGPDPRENPSPTSTYQQVKGERAAARAAERNSIHDGSSNEAAQHWQAIINLAPGLLAKESKDLEVASWLTEALVRKNGFQGLRDGAKTIHLLLTNFWDGLYPEPDEDGIETRVAPLSGLNGEGAEGVLIAPIRKVEITEGQSIGPFSLWQYQQALNNQKMADEDARERSIAKLGFSVEDIEKAVGESSSEFFINIRDDLDECLTLFKEIGTLLDEHCGHDAPSVRNITDILDECRGAVNHLGRNKFPVEVGTSESDDGDAAPEELANDTPAAATVAAQPAKLTREVAFKQLLDLAEFFRESEPHSPVSYMLEKAVRWGEMPLHELIPQLINDHSSLERFSDLTGVTVEN
ncbi:type VI secretion system protein TssA [Agaribacterium haliotis]|uniref:type VI secretion system protein TssA n=1 Tax=Agaribacterium haliotis TaxID=2013869 RepID=UPI000BB55FFD|nr:type VI secretion system protein TssA [Agaribacterium haliotis]